MDQELVIRRGAAAAALLSNTDFEWFFEDLTQRTLEAILNTKPDETKARENLYFQLNGLRDLLGTMQSYADASEAIRKMNELQDMEEELD